MGKWLSNLVTPLVILLATTLITAVAKGPIDELVNQNRLKAEVELAPWIDRGKNADDPLDEATHTTASLRHVLQSTDTLGVARINIKNDSGKLVSNISFEMPSYSKDEGFLINANQEMQELSNLDKIDIPDMSPGDKVTVFIWGSFLVYRLDEEFKSYSSEGKFRTTFYWPENQGLESHSTIDAILDGFIWIGGSGSAILLLIILAIGWAQHSEFIKLILTYPKAYELEKARFWENPREFSPDWNLLTENHYKPHALFGEPDGDNEQTSSSAEETAAPESNPKKES